MRHLGLVAGLFLLPSAALAGGSDFCLTGAVGASEQSVNCASSWIAADGTRLGPVADPRNTPRTPYNYTSPVWSGASAGYSTQAAPVWQSAAPATSYGTGYRNQAAAYSSGYVSGTPTVVQNVPSAGHGQVLVTRGAHSNTIYTSDSNWGSSYAAPVPYSTQGYAPVVRSSYGSGYTGGYSAPVASSAGYYSGATHQTQPMSYGAQSGCFTYGAGGQPHPVSCQVPAQTYYAPAPRQVHVAVIQPAPMIAPPIAAAPVVSFYNGLNGGVGYGMPVYSGGGGGGAYFSGGSSSVLGRAPLLRMRSRNTGKGGHTSTNTGSHDSGCNPCGGGTSSGHH